MRLVPAIDLKDGRCVRLSQGRLESAKVYADDPAAQARAFVDAGARWIHVVDLDGAFAGTSQSGEAIAAIAASGAKVQAGGGLRSLAAVEALFTLGATRVVLGTAAVTDPALLSDACAAFPGRILVAVDAKEGEVQVEGWAKRTGKPVLEIAARARDAGAVGLLYTDILRDGMGGGVNVEATAELARAAGLPVIASGGIKGMDDLEALAAHQGIEGAIAGRSIYEGTLDVAAACARFADSTLLD